MGREEGDTFIGGLELAGFRHDMFVCQGCKVEVV